MTREEILKDLAVRGFKDPEFFCRTFLPHWFPSKMPWVHLGLLAIILRKTEFLRGRPELSKICKFFRDRQGQALFSISPDGAVHLRITSHTTIMMPRGFSKTTLCNACTIYQIVYKLRTFILYVSESGPHAKTQLGNVKRELEINPLILEVFGTFQPERQSSLKWTEEEIHTLNGVFVAARGQGAQVRGLNINGIRPNQVIIDDVEDKESVSTDEQRAKLREWAYGDLFPILPAMDPTAALVMLGTLLHAESLLMTVANDPKFTAIRFGAQDPDGDYIWPEMKDEAKLEIDKASFAAAGQLHTFYMEYHSTLRHDATAKFRAEFITIRSYDRSDFAAVAMAIDPAISNKPGADFFSICVAGMTQRGEINILESVGDIGVPPREQIDEYFRLSLRWNVNRHGVESIGYQAALVHLMREEMFRRKRYFEIIPITHSMKKEERVEGILQPRYAAGYITHRTNFPLLVQQLLDWPRGKMDFPDSAAMAIALLDPYAAAAADPEIDLGDDEYPPLAEVLKGTFATAP